MSIGSHLGIVGQIRGGVSVRVYLFRRRILICLIIGYVLAALYGPRLGRSEFYPFFNWDLFSYTHSTRYDFVVIVHSIDGVDLKEPTIYFYVPNHFIMPDGEKIRLRKLLGDLWGHKRKGDRKQVEKLLSIIRSKYFSSIGSAEYEIAFIRYNPIERLKTGKIEFSKTIIRTSK